MFDLETVLWDFYPHEVGNAIGQQQVKGDPPPPPPAPRFVLFMCLRWREGRSFVKFFDLRLDVGEEIFLSRPFRRTSEVSLTGNKTEEAACTE